MALRLLPRVPLGARAGVRVQRPRTSSSARNARCAVTRTLRLRVAASEESEPAKLEQEYTFHTPGSVQEPTAAPVDVVFQHEQPDEAAKWEGTEIMHIGQGDETPINVGIVIGEFHNTLMDQCLEDARLTAEANGAKVVKVVWVPGTYEAPTVVQYMLESPEIDCVAVLGYIEKGSTKHGEEMGATCSLLFKQMELEYRKPVGMGIIGPGATAEQAAKRVAYAGNGTRAAIRLARHLKGYYGQKSTPQVQVSVPPKQPEKTIPADSPKPSSPKSEPVASGAVSTDSEVPTTPLKFEEGSKYPSLQVGADNIKWMDTLHKALEEQGFYCGEEDVEDWIFGPGTQDALIYFQNSVGLPETGITDPKTWAALLGHEFEEPSSSTSSASAGSSSTGILTEEEAEKLATKMKALTMDDGGKEVLLLQRLLEGKGFDCGDDEIEWWQFGGGTEHALIVFQACSNLPETGRCTSADWVKLLTGSPAKLLQDIENEEDLRSEQGVYLLGEQRFERKRKA